jgi:hypothetical protein
MGNCNVTYWGMGVGNKNDYLTLEEAARMLGRPVSSLQGVMSEMKLTAKLAGGCWQISVRDYEKLRENLPPEPEKVVHNFLSERSEKPQRNSTFQVTSRQDSTRVSARKDKESNSANERSDLYETRKQLRIKALETEIRIIRPALERIIRQRQAAILRGNVPPMNRPSKDLLRKWRKLQDELDRLQGKPKWDKHITRKGASKKVEKPNKKGRNTGGIKGYYAGPEAIRGKRYWFNEED